MTISAQFSAARPLIIGTRRSPLAMAQAHMVADAIVAAHGLPADAVRLSPMLSSGDKVQDRPLAEIGGKALWTKELERALISGEIEIAVHSMKDVETIRPPEFSLSAMLPRADVRDRLVGASSIAALPQGATLGTSSPRRAAQLLFLRPDLNIVMLRGNVATRLAQIEAGVADATLLAAAGLDRLGMGDMGHAISIDDMLPAAAQGAVGIDCLSSRADLADFLDIVNDPATYDCVMAERALLFALGGNCHSPIAALAQIAGAQISGDQITLRGEILSLDGTERQAGQIVFDRGDRNGPAELARQLLEAASPALKGLFCP
jgi:hydroxymethylbilane synthase